jgi:putative MATE family efflux protein
MAEFRKGHKKGTWLMNTHKSNQITEGVIWKQLLAFFFPILLGTFFQQLYNTTDAIVIGQFAGKQAFAAVGGPATIVINLLIGFFVGFSTGASVVIAQFYGARRENGTTLAVHTSVALALLSGALLMAVCFFLAPSILRAMNTPADILPDAETYMRIYALGMIPNLFYNMGAGILRAAGDSKRPLYFLIAGCLINVVLDLLFVAVFPLGAAGAAIATILSQLFSALMVLAALMRSKDIFRLQPRQLCLDRDMLRRIVSIGLPSGIQSSMYSISNLLIQSSINVFGTDTVAGWAAHGKLDSIYWMIMGAYGAAITTFAGQNCGAGKMDRVKKSIRICLGMSGVTSVLVGAGFLAFGRVIMRVFTSDAVVLDLAMEMFWAVAPFYLTYVCVEIIGGAIRGCGNSLGPMLITCFGVCVLRVIWVYTVLPLRPVLSTLMIIYPISWAVTSVFLVIYYRRGRWLRAGAQSIPS